MLDDILSGLVGSTLAELAKRRWPPRNLQDADKLPASDLQRRNRPIYRLSAVCGCIVFILMMVYSYSTSHRTFWLIGALFGLPFTSMAITSIAMSLAGGPRRLAEYLRSWELREGVNLWLLIIACGPLGVLGLVCGLIVVIGNT